MKKIILSIDGMTCSACSNGLEKYLNKQNGIINASVNLVMANATVDYDISVPGMDPNIPIAGIHMVDQALVNGKLSIDLTADMTVNPGICFITVTGKVGGAMSQTVQTAVTILE